MDDYGNLLWQLWADDLRRLVQADGSYFGFFGFALLRDIRAGNQEF